MKITDKFLTCLGLLWCLSVQSVLADEAKTTFINWNQLNLSPEQNNTIQSLNSDWNHQYMELKPAIDEEQRKLTRMLTDPNSDPLEIISLQASIERKRGQLKTVAINNYLHKRQILNMQQQQQLQDMVRNAILERQKQLAGGSNTDPMSERIQSLMKQLNGIFPGNNQ
jgi:Spy/CpxP family protein refolding chaperone